MGKDTIARFVAIAAIAASLPSFASERYDSHTIMSFNICHCATNYTLSVTDEEVRRTAALISSVAPDFACLQEVDDKTTRSSGIDETARIAELTGMHGVFGKALDYQGGGYGVAILSKNEPLSVTTRTVEGSETRVLLICEFDDFCVATIHLDNNKALRLESIATIREELARLSKPVFLTGDWNATPDSDTLALIKEFMVVISPEHNIVTLISQMGVRDEYVIDYVAVDSAHREDFHVHRTWCVDNRVNGIGSSDHNPVMAEVYRHPAASELGWVDEAFLSTGRTGTWMPSLAWDESAWKAELGGENMFTPNTPSGGDRVTMDVTVAFDAIPAEHETPDNTAHAAIWLGTNGCFQVWSLDGWIDVEADGITPATGVDYTFRFTFDYMAKSYSVTMQYGAEWKQLVGRAIPHASSFPLATSATAVSVVRFTGDGAFTSLFGEYVAAEGFAENDELVLNNSSVILDAAKAAWLNSCAGGRDALVASASELSADDFDKAYLLNLDITGENSYEFRIASIDLEPVENKVTIGVSLTRTGAIAQTINGRLFFYGADSVSKFTNGSLAPLGDAVLSNDDFSDGDTATATIQLDEDADTNFYRATIEEAE